MHTQQTIVIIGGGKTGRGIASGLARGDDRVLLTDTDETETAAFVGDLQAAHPRFDVEALQCSFEACWEGDIIILALPFAAQKAVAERIKAVACRKIVVTTDNCVEELQKLLPHSRIVQAFSSIDQNYFDEEYTTRKAVDCFIYGKDEEAVKIVASLVKTIGFKPVIQLTSEKAPATP